MNEISGRPGLAPHVRRHPDRATGGVLLLHPEGAIELSDTADAIVRLCDGNHTVEAIVAELADEYDAPVERIREDVAACLGELAKAGLIRFA
jgi:coenzyme PQQ biosynthesis protein PqqD